MPTPLSPMPVAMVPPPDSAGGDVRAAIARAAAASGVDFSYLMAQARLESRLNPTATNNRSSARGLYQFTRGTWAQTLARHGDALDEALGGDGSGGAGVTVALGDPAARARLMALRDDPQAAATMAAALAGDNQVALTHALGRAPDPAELYLAHFLGIDGATTFLAALAADPAQSAAALLPRAAAGNAAVFCAADGSARSVGAVMALVRARMAGAMAETPAGADAAAPAMLLGAPVYAVAATPGQALPVGGPLAQEFAAAAGASARADASAGFPGDASAGVTAQASMADTLRSAFGMGDGGASSAPVPAFVRSAYGRMQALGF